MAFTSEQEDELWHRWRRGEPSSLIARELRTSPWAVRALLAKHGGVRPPSRRRSARHLTVAEREEVSRGIAAGLSSRAIATIYRTIYLAGRRELGPTPARHLRSGRSVRHARRVKQSHGRGVLRNMVSIRQRPVAVTERVEVGHWEGDLVMGKRPSAVATLVERSTRYMRVVPLPDGYKAHAVRHAIAGDLAQLPPTIPGQRLPQRWRELGEHQELAAQLGIDVYFCDPRSPWQRGSNENANRLLRQ